MEILQTASPQEGTRLPSFGCVFSALVKPYGVGEDSRKGAGELAFAHWNTVTLRASEVVEIRYLGNDTEADPEIPQGVWEALVRDNGGEVRVFLTQPHEESRQVPRLGEEPEAEYHSDDGCALAVANLTGLSNATCERIEQVWCDMLDGELSGPDRRALWHIRHNGQAVFRFVLHAGQVRGFRVQGPAGEIEAARCAGGGVVLVPIHHCEECGARIVPGVDVHHADDGLCDCCGFDSQRQAVAAG